MDCNEFRNRVADLFDREASPQVRTECERHMAECPSCRAYYEDLRSVDKLLRPQYSPVEMPHREVRPVRRWMRIAAMFIGIALLGGVAWAVVGYRLKSSQTQTPQSAQLTTPLPPRERQGGGSSIHFDNVRLDSLLSVVAGHYGKVVQFRDDEAREMRLIMTWNPADSLADFVSRLNRFEGLTLTLREDTLVVESGNGEGE
ncbi:MAG: zf-HC2 domain-containing protein [Bacteroidaceae bacterium]|nr:zf-HC2 domain-containing protein [Bacteroidaceae bacterium]